MGIKDLLKSKLNTKKSSNKTTYVKEREITEEERKWLEDIKDLKEGHESPLGKIIYDHFKNSKSIYLDDKVTEYINWNFDNFVKGNYTDIGEYHVPIELRNFIEKVAVWYELRYPDYEINRLMPGSSQELLDVNNEMFNYNSYINDVLDKNSEVRLLEWDRFYNKETFINSLPWEERYRLERADYTNLVYLDPSLRFYNSLEANRVSPHLHLTSEGYIREAEGISFFTNDLIKDDELKGKHVKELLKLLKDNNITLPEDNELERAINFADRFQEDRDRFLDAVMYRIIERGGNRIGPRRAFLFAKEFDRNIDIPMAYGVDRTDPGLRDFINTYLKAGGSLYLNCYVNYFFGNDKKTIINTETIEDLLKIKDKYTEEEKQLQQRLADTLSEYVTYKDSENSKELGNKKNLNK